MLETIRAIGPRLYDFHVADNNRMACGPGRPRLAEDRSTLKEVGYDGALTVEFVAPIDRTPANAISRRSRPTRSTSARRSSSSSWTTAPACCPEGFYSMLVETCATTLLPLIMSVT